ncbi:hypothetical protein KCU65_g5026, partial [Aureobasidium melanogenum]
MSPATIPTGLLEGEQLETFHGAPCLYKFCPATSSNPLIVLIPGGAHNARIFYGGHDTHDPDEFLAAWLNKLGHGVLSISYPLESQPEIMSANAPHFRISDWGQQAAEVTHHVIDQNKLSRDVVLVAWSMGGRILVPYCKAVKSLGLNVRSFISLCATPGLPGIRPPSPGIVSTKAGYASLMSTFNMFLKQVHEQANSNKEKPVFSDEDYRSCYFGHTPVSLLGNGLRFDRDDVFIVDKYLSDEDAAAHEFLHLPWISSLTPTSPLDARHVLTDKSTWNYMLTQRLCALYEKSPAYCSARGSGWQDLIQLSELAQNSLSATIEGNHFFFIGRRGAEITVQAIIKQICIADSLTYDHSQLKTGHPVRSAIHKQLNGRLVLRWVTTWECCMF